MISNMQYRSAIIIHQAIKSKKHFFIGGQIQENAPKIFSGWFACKKLFGDLFCWEKTNDWIFFLEMLHRGRFKRLCATLPLFAIFPKQIAEYCIVGLIVNTATTSNVLWSIHSFLFIKVTNGTNWNFSHGTDFIVSKLKQLQRNRNTHEIYFSSVIEQII